MEEKLKPIIKDNNIINLHEIIEMIKVNSNEEFLEDYLIEIEDFENNSSNVIKDLNNIKISLISRLSEIKIKEFNEFENKFISENEFNRFLGMLYSGDKLTEENLKDLYSYVNASLVDMEQESLDYDKQNSLDIYIYYLKDKMQNNELNNEENKILSHYEEIIIKINQEIEKENLNEINKGKVLKLISKENSTRGAIVTVVILEVTILLGILISVVALAKR